MILRGVDTDSLVKPSHHRECTEDETIIREILEKLVYVRVRDVDTRIYPGETWLDLGAHIGCFACYVASREAVPICYEPETENYKLLIQNLQSLGVGEGYCAAVTHHKSGRVAMARNTRKPSNKPRELRSGRFSVCDKGEMDFSVPNLYAGNLPKADGAKIDIEGSEFGIIDAGLLPNVERLILEYHYCKDRSISNWKRRRDILKSKWRVVSYPKCMDTEHSNDRYPGVFDRYIFCEGKK